MVHLVPSMSGTQMREIKMAKFIPPGKDKRDLPIPWIPMMCVLPKEEQYAYAFIMKMGGIAGEPLTRDLVVVDAYLSQLSVGKDIV